MTVMIPVELRAWICNRATGANADQACRMSALIQQIGPVVCANTMWMNVSTRHWTPVILRRSVKTLQTATHVNVLRAFWIWVRIPMSRVECAHYVSPLSHRDFWIISRSLLFYISVVNECLLRTHDCDPLALCEDTPESYRCQCAPGFLDISPSAAFPGRHCRQCEKNKLNLSTNHHCKWISSDWWVQVGQSRLWQKCSLQRYRRFICLQLSQWLCWPIAQ